ncbi:hypothetical protein V6N13_009780 [Hibiscus sabdariffa]|uniref:Uncharacterized protein n=1 Tax=Hibiscus sabdariffa TaxID=183260 RepID=A0ABR2B9D3_9ROSI
MKKNRANYSTVVSPMRTDHDGMQEVGQISSRKSVSGEKLLAGHGVSHRMVDIDSVAGVGLSRAVEDTRLMAWKS